MDAVETIAETLAAAIDTIEGYVTADSATALTIAELTATGVTGTVDANLAEYKTAIAAKAAVNVDTTAEIQVIIRTTNVLKEMAENRDLTRRLEVKSNDQVGAMAIYFNNFIDEIQKILRETTIYSGDLSVRSEQLSVTI